MNRIVKGMILGAVLGAVAFCLYNLFNKNELNTVEKVDGNELLLIVNEKVNFKNNVSFISNEKCNSKDKKNNYTLTLENNEVVVNNLDNFVNFSLDKFKKVKMINSFSYNGKCDKSIYVLLTSDGKLYFTNNRIVNLKNIKKINREFILFDTKYKFDQIYVGEDNKLYAKSEDKLFRVNLNNSSVMK